LCLDEETRLRLPPLLKLRWAKKAEAKVLMEMVISTSSTYGTFNLLTSNI